MKKFLIFLVAAAFVFGSVLPAMAQDKSVSFYGRVYFKTFIIDKDKETLTTGYDDQDLEWNIKDSITRFGANFKAGDITGKVEIRPKSGSIMRVWSGTWDFGTGKLTLGQDYVPSFMPADTAVDYGAVGALGGTVRSPLIQLTFPVGNGTLKIAGIKPNDPGVGVGFGTTDTDTTIPKLEASYDVKFGPAHLKLVGGYNTYDEVNATDQEEGVDSWLAGSYFSIGFGAITLNANLYTGENLKQYGISDDTLGAKYYTTGLEDSETLGYHASVVWVISDKFRLTGGYGAVSSERTNPTAGTDDEDDKSGWYVNAPIYVTKGFVITPQIAVVDEEDSTTDGVTDEDEGKTTYIGARWTIRF